MIQLIEKDEDEFKLITLAEVEKFDQTYQLKIAGLEADKEKLIDKISKQEKLLQDYEKVAVLKSGDDDDDKKKNDKLVKKYKVLKGKIRTLDSLLSENEKQKVDLRKHIEAKDELIKLKDIEILDLEKNKLVITLTIESKNRHLEDLVKTKEGELRQIKHKLK